MAKESSNTTATTATTTARTTTTTTEDVNNTSGSSSSSVSTTNAAGISTAVAEEQYNVAWLCGWSTSKCGYCHGDRAYLVLPRQPQQEQEQEQVIMTEDDEEEKSTTTSKEEDQRQKPPPNSSRAYGVWFESLSCEDYLHLINHGWRRSGKHLYLPDNFNSCCPAIPIRLDVSKFQMDKHQRRVLRTMALKLQQHTKVNDIINTAATVPLPPQTTAANNTYKKKVRLSDDVAHVVATGTSPSSLLPDSVLTYVQQIIQNCILQSLQQQQQKQQNKDINEKEVFDKFLSSVLPDISKLCAMKLRKRNEFRNKNKDIEQQQEQAVLATSACAAIAGRSRGFLLAFPLAEDVVSNFYQLYVSPNISRVVTSNIIIEIHNVAVLPSGHITVTLSITDVTTTATETVPPPGVTSTEDGQKEQERHAHNNSNDRLPSSTEAVTAASMDLLVVGKRTASSSPTSSARDDNSTTAPEDHLAAILGIPPGHPHTLTVTSVPSKVSFEQLEVHRLYAKYQHTIHGDEDPYAGSTSSTSVASRRKIEKARTSFERFLVDSPLPSVVDAYKNCSSLFCMDKDGYDVLIPYGSYHQQYRIDGKLIAVGVVDVLPQGLSSVYCFFDPTLSSSSSGCSLNLGKYTALREIQWMERAALHKSQFNYYYLGFYIHSCQKMKYKAEYRPCALLCPTKKIWVDFQIAKPLIEASSPKDCCTLAVDVLDRQQEQPADAAASAVRLSNIHSTASGDTATNNNEENEENEHISQLVNEMLIEIGQNNNDSPDYSHQMTVSMLNSYGRKVVVPLINDLVDALGPTVSKRCIVRL